MANRGRLTRFIRQRARAAGRQYEEARRAYQEAHDAVLSQDLPTDEYGRARIVCRRFAERRAVAIDEASRPTCFDPNHPDCEGCKEDILRGRIETW